MERKRFWNTKNNTIVVESVGNDGSVPTSSKPHKMHIHGLTDNVLEWMPSLPDLVAAVKGQTSDIVIPTTDNVLVFMLANKQNEKNRLFVDILARENDRIVGELGDNYTEKAHQDALDAFVSREIFGKMPMSRTASPI
mgnify:CR=1 FL=1